MKCYKINVFSELSFFTNYFHYGVFKTGFWKEYISILPLCISFLQICFHTGVIWSPINMHMRWLKSFSVYFTWYCINSTYRYQIYYYIYLFCSSISGAGLILVLYYYSLEIRYTCLGFQLHFTYRMHFKICRIYVLRQWSASQSTFLDYRTNFKGSMFVCNLHLYKDYYKQLWQC